MVYDFLPNIRGLVSHELHDRGESQRRIALLLGITQARVSYYLTTKKASFITEISSKFGLTQGEVQSYARILSEDVARSQADGIFTLYSIWKNLLYSGNACLVHEKNFGVSSNCSVCMELHKPSRESSSNDAGNEDSQILHELSEAVSVLENSSFFPSIMPEVSVNLAMSRTRPKSSRDVAAIPGRINRIHGRAKALMIPEFGCSKHMSSVLLIFKSKNPNLNAVMNLKYDRVVERLLTTLGIPKVFTPLSDVRRRRLIDGAPTDSKSADSADPVIPRLRNLNIPKHLSSSRSPFAVIDKGSEGVEPITYLFGIRALDVVQTAVKIARHYSDLQLEIP